MHAGAPRVRLYVSVSFVVRPRVFQVVCQAGSGVVVVGKQAQSCIFLVAVGQPKSCSYLEGTASSYFQEIVVHKLFIQQFLSRQTFLLHVVIYVFFVEPVVGRFVHPCAVEYLRIDAAHRLQVEVGGQPSPGQQLGPDLELRTEGVGEVEA